MTPKIRTLVLAAFVLATPASGLAHECAIYNVYRPVDLEKGRSMTIGVFSVEGRGATPDKMRSLQAYAAERLRAEVSALRYFSSVQVIDSPAGTEADLHLEGAITDIHEGSRWLRTMRRSAAAKVRVEGAIRLKSGDSLLDFECEGEEVGGLGGGFGLVAGLVDGLFAALDSSESLLRKSFERIAADFARNIKDVNDERQRQLKGNSRRRDASEGTTARRNKLWRQRPRAEWTPVEHSREVNAFVVETQNKDWFRVHALWLSAPAYASNAYLNDFEFGDGEHELADGLLPDLAPARALLERPGYVIGVTFESGASDGSTDGHEAPFFWDDSTVLGATYLTRKGEPARRFAATDAVRLTAYLQRRGAFQARWRNVPVVFVFPARSDDGTPLVQSFTDEIELHTTVGDRRAVARFRLADLELTELTDLHPTR